MKRRFVCIGGVARRAPAAGPPGGLTDDGAPAESGLDHAADRKRGGWSDGPRLRHPWMRARRRPRH